MGIRGVAATTVAAAEAMVSFLTFSGGRGRGGGGGVGRTRGGGAADAAGAGEPVGGEAGVGLATGGAKGTSLLCSWLRWRPETLVALQVLDT